MPDINAGLPVRFESGGTIQIGSDPILNVVSGTLTWKVRGYQPIPHRDRGKLQGVLAGDEQGCSLGLDVMYTAGANGMVGTGTPPGGFLSKLFGALTSGKINNRTSTGELFTFNVTIRIPDGMGVATGDQYVFEKCYLPDGADFAAVPGADFDKLTISLESHSLTPTMSRY
jgi:hypothetical protein